MINTCKNFEPDAYIINQIMQVVNNGKFFAFVTGTSKGKDFANALGPYLVPFSELRDRYQNGRLDLNMSAFINGKRVSQGNASSMYWSWPQLLAHASRDTNLLPGDVIGSGTVGTGCILELTPEVAGGWLKAGDIVQLEIERLGILENCVAVR